MGDKLRLALVGCGAISEWHRMGIRNVPEIEIVAAVDVERARAEAAAAEYGAAVFTSLEDALARGDFDAVDLMLPPDLHEAAAVACFAARKHVLLEKPMATTVEACDRILAAAGRSSARRCTAGALQPSSRRRSCSSPVRPLASSPAIRWPSMAATPPHSESEQGLRQ